MERRMDVIGEWRGYKDLNGFPSEEERYLLSKVPLREAGGDDKLCEADGVAELDEGDVVVECPGLVALVDQNPLHIVDGLSSFLHLGVKLT